MTVEIDGANNIIKTNTISEVTSANGVTVDGLNIKDSKLVTADSVIEANMSANSVDSDSYVDASIDAAHLSSNVITGQTALTSVANDDLVLLSDTSGSAALKKMTVANLVANAGGGKIGQVIQTHKADAFSTTSTSYTGISGFNRAITPAATSSKILVSLTFNMGMGAQGTFWCQLARTIGGGSEVIIAENSGDGSENAFFATGLRGTNPNYEMHNVALDFLDTTNTTSEVFYYMKIRCDSSTLYLNRVGATVSRSAVSQITVMEVLA
jgi:hypothetical protein